MTTGAKSGGLQQTLKGIFIVIEGTDGSGKGTQFELLKNEFEKQGVDYEQFDFPQYSEGSSYFVKKYLNGEYGSAEDVGPYTASLFYALDRYDVKKKLDDALAAGKVVIANRFIGSNMAHQGTKFASSEERRGFFVWCDSLEHTMLGIPRPDLSIVLKMDAEIAQQLVDQKAERDYTDKKRDLHEADLGHLEKSVQVYEELTQLFPKDFIMIDCARGGKPIERDVIKKMIWEKVMPLLPLKRQKDTSSQKADAKTASNVAQKPINPYVTKTENGPVVTEEGLAYLKRAVTNVDGQVYGFYDSLSLITIAAAMARLSRRADDMRVTILDEFTEVSGKDSDLLKRVITAYGDDSVQQLVGQHIVVEDASNLLTKKLEWGRLAAYLEQSTRYIYFDTKDKNGKYRYFIPEHFDPQTKATYIHVMNQIFDLYSDMVQALTEYVRKKDKTPENERDIAWKGATRAQACDAIRPVLPVATKATVGIFASGQALESLIMHLLADDLPEARDIGQQMLQEARKTVPAFLERADKPDRGGAMIAYRQETYNAVKEAAATLLGDEHSDDAKSVNLLDYWPKNELDLVPDMLYEHSNLSLEEIKKKTALLEYDVKKDVFETYIGKRLNRRQRPGRAMEVAHYRFDLVCDYGIFRDLQRHRMVDDMNWQALSPRFGYEVPELVTEAGLADTFERCFDLSLELYSTLQSAGYALEAQYATLLGHKMRWKVTMNAREAIHFIELRTTPQGHPGYRKLAKEMHDALAEVHPLVAESMIFVNKDEDPELTRLAAERYTQWKLNQLDK
jgi:thymidylate kinase/thymidylate synthase ThyX